MKNYNLGMLKAAGWAAACAIGLALPASAAVDFLGVAAGDASNTEATLWTRAVDPNAPAVVALTAQVSTNYDFGSGVVTYAVATDAAKDFTAKVTATGLSPGTRYYYRFTDGSGYSPAGTFKTAPDAGAAVPVSFAFSGDVDGLMRPYALASQIPGKQLDFFMFDGDTIYETSASIGSPAVTSTGTIPGPTSTGATANQLFADFSRKYREQFLPVNAGGQNCLGAFYAGQGNYTTYDNHELGNKQYINGGAPAGGAVGDFSTGAGVDARGSTNDVTPGSGPFMNKSGGFQTLQQIYLNYQPVKERGVISAANDLRTDGTRQLYFAQQWGKHVILVNVDDRTYRDIRMKTASNGEETGPRADNSERTMLGATQLAWLEQTLLQAQQAGVTWKFVNISDPIDQIGPIGGTLSLNGAPRTADYGLLGGISNLTTTAATSNGKTLTVASTVGLVVGQAITGPDVPTNTAIAAINTDGTTFAVNNTCSLTNGTPITLTPAASTYVPVSSDGGKSWMGGYRAERNALLKFIADNQILNVVFLATDDHQSRINELTYSTNGVTSAQSTYVKVPSCFAVVCGPLGATGPDFIQNHSFSLAKSLADSIANAQAAAGIEPIGLVGYPGLHDLVREGDATAAETPQPVDFYSPDTFNYSKFDVSADGKRLSITIYGINSTVQNSFAEYDAANNPERPICSFQIQAANPINNIEHFIVIYQENWSFDSLYGYFPGANGIANASAASLTQMDRITGASLSSELGATNYINPSRILPAQSIPPQPIAFNGLIDTNFASDLNTLLPYNLSSSVDPANTTGDIVHRYWQEQFQIDHGSNDLFVTWSDNPGLVMSYYDASIMPEGLLAKQYVLCDNFFHSAFGGSFLNHQFLIAAQAPVYPHGEILAPSKVTTLDSGGLLATNAAGRIIRDQWLTPSNGVVFADTNLTFGMNYAVNTAISQNLANGAITNPVVFNTFLPPQNDSNPDDSERPYIPTIGDRLEAAGVSWKWYSGGWDRALAISASNPTNAGLQKVDSSISLFQWHHQPFAYYDNYAPWTNGVRNPRSVAHLQDENAFLADLTNNTLPAVCFIKPIGPDNEHPGYASLMQGQLHVSNLVAAVQANPAIWAHTAIIITYDEHGGRWDHVAPPARDIWGPGVRVPAIIISPYAKTGHVDHTQYDTTAILTSIEQRFELTPLNSLDANAITLLNAFSPSVSDPSTPPTLAFARSEDSVTLSWPGVYLTYKLQSKSSGLNSPSGWVDVQDVEHNSITVSLDNTKTHVFYRLIKR